MKCFATFSYFKLYQIFFSIFVAMIWALWDAPQANGDGLAVGIEAGGIVVDKNMVQLHPTAFIDPQDPTNPTKVQ